MNNKISIFLLVLIVLLLTGCRERHCQVIDAAYKLSSVASYSALLILDNINQVHPEYGVTEV